MVVEFVCPLVRVDSVDVDHTEGERDVHDDEDEQENHDVEDHVRHADDYRTFAKMRMVRTDFFSTLFQPQKSKTKGKNSGQKLEKNSNQTKEMI